MLAMNSSKLRGWGYRRNTRNLKYGMQFIFKTNMISKEIQNQEEMNTGINLQKLPLNHTLWVKI